MGDSEPEVTQQRQLSEEEKAEEERLLNIRRQAELKLIAQYDRNKIDARVECWFLMDTQWLDAWTRFVRGEAGPPGKLSTAELLDDKGQPVKGLEATRDYRGVVPVVYFIFRELYGKDDSPELMRYVVDVYEQDVPGKYKMEIVHGPQNEARIEAIKLRQLWEEWDRDSEDGEEDLCCGLTREHIEAIMFWFFTCCNRGDKPKYLKYKPLRDMGDDDGDEEEGGGGGGEQEQKSAEAGSTTRAKGGRQSYEELEDDDEESQSAPLQKGEKTVQMTTTRPKPKTKAKKKGMRR